MDVVIFCGGRGTRLMEKTEVLPKPLVNVGTRPILWHIMKIYESYGCNRFILPIGYKGDEIKKWFHHYAFETQEKMVLHLNKPQVHTNLENWEVVLQETGVETGTAKRLALVANDITSKQFHVTYGDGVASININDVIAHHNKMRQQFGILGTISTVQPQYKFGVIEHDAFGIIKSFREKPQMTDWVNIGFMVFEREVLQYVEHATEQEMFEQILPQIAAEGKLAIYKHNGFFMAMDSFKDYTDINKLWETTKPWKNWK